MAKKKSKKVTTVNNIDSVSLEIDYDKLAEAIIKAQNESVKRQKRSKFRSTAMNFFNGTIYAVVYSLAIVMVYVVWAECYATQTIPLIGCIIFTAIFAFVGIYAFLCQQETHNDSDSDTITHFNTNIALVALIIAMIALFQSNGATEIVPYLEDIKKLLSL